MNNLDRIKSLRAQDYGVAGLSTTDVDWLIAEVERLTATTAVDIDSICNAYESGVGHRGRPTAHINPYREGTPEHEAYAIGAKGEAAQAEAKVANETGEDAD